MNEQRNPRQVPPRPLHICCIHGQKTQNIETCKNNIQPYKKEIFPCCMHLNQQNKFLTCLHVYLFYILLIFNAFQIFMLLAKYIICSLLPTNITIPCAIVCLVYWQSAYFDPLDKNNCFIIFGVCAIDILAEFFMWSVPRFLLCSQIIFIGVVGLFWMRGIVKRKAKCTAEKTDRLEKIIKKQEVITISKKYLKNQVQKCCICFVKNSNFMLLPCMHRNYCQDCVNRIDICSLCRKPISEKINYSDHSL